jgi:peptidoglycan/LPS O-acetylase OafA/YrhL
MKNVGMWASVVCAIHCTILPLLAILIPTTGIYLFINETFEYILLAFSLLFNITNVCFGYRQHKSNKALAVLALGLFLFVIGRLLHHHNHHIGFQFDLFNIFMILGGILMALSSLMNDNMCKHCKTCEIKK